MSELNERVWAVLSERGCFARDLVYEEAAELIRKLAREEARGLCIVTNNAARHLPPPEQCPDDSSSGPTEIRTST